MENEDKKYLDSGELGFIEQELEEKVEIHKNLNPKI